MVQECAAGGMMPTNLEGDDLSVLGDAAVACAELASQGAAIEFQIARFNDEGPPRWFAHVAWKGYRVSTDNHPTPTVAADALAAKVLETARCRCGRRATAIAGMGDGRNWCTWTRIQARWLPGCDAPPLLIDRSQAGDLEAVRRAAKERFGD